MNISYFTFVGFSILLIVGVIFDLIFLLKKLNSNQFQKTELNKNQLKKELDFEEQEHIYYLMKQNWQSNYGYHTGY